MSDYGEDDFSDYGDDWFYVEDEYMAADDLAEHAVNSPPPTNFADDDIEEWDRFDYFNDLEYASDGYDDGEFYTHTSQTPQAGQKRKRGGEASRGKKRRKLGESSSIAFTDSSKLTLSPVAWRSQKKRTTEPKLFDEKNSESYALLKDWRDHLAETPAWAAGAALVKPSESNRSTLANVEDLAPRSDEDFEDDKEEEEEEEEEGEGNEDIDPAIVMSLLEKRMAEAGGPLAGMDQQQLFQSVLRMMDSADAGEDIAGELADSLLNQERDTDEGDEDAGEAPAGILDWLLRHGEGSSAHLQDSATTSAQLPGPTSPIAKYGSHPPLTPPSSEANRSIRAQKDCIEAGNSTGEIFTASQQNRATLGSPKDIPSRKRKATNNEDEADNAPRKRASKANTKPKQSAGRGLRTKNV